MILLDTHALWWLDQDVPSLGDAALGAADEALTAGVLAVSAISFCEVAALVIRGRLALEGTVAEWREAILGHGVLECAVDGSVAIRAVELENLHREPADRLIIASALELEATLVTVDERLLAWPGPLRAPG